MKKVLLTTVFALGTLTAIQAQETEDQNPTKVEATVSQEQEDKMLAKVEATSQDFKEVTRDELPAAVAEAVATDFKGATVQKAYVNEKEQYKLVLSTNAKGLKAGTKTVFATKEGKWLKTPQAKMKQ